MAGKRIKKTLPDGTEKLVLYFVRTRIQFKIYICKYKFRPEIELSTRDDWLTVVGSLSDGTCAGTKNRVPVNFGENMRSGCTFT